MKKISGVVRRAALRAAGPLSVALLVGCAVAPSASAPARVAPSPAQSFAPCADTLYAQLRAEHPDSLSEREWQRLQELDRECDAARAGLAPESDHGMDAGHHGMWWMASGLVMTLMMAAMWIS